MGKSRYRSACSETAPPQSLFRGIGDFSSTRTDRPATASLYAADAPAGPPPTTIASHLRTIRLTPESTQYSGGDARREVGVAQESEGAPGASPPFSQPLPARVPSGASAPLRTPLRRWYYSGQMR